PLSAPALSCFARSRPHSFPTRRSSDLILRRDPGASILLLKGDTDLAVRHLSPAPDLRGLDKAKLRVLPDHFDVVAEARKLVHTITLLQLRDSQRSGIRILEERCGLRHLQRRQ